MTPLQEYRRLNKLIWLGRLPDATVILVDNATIPLVSGVTCHNGSLFVKPVIMLNSKSPWFATLVHEMLHVAEPKLDHGPIFEKLVRKYIRLAKHKKVHHVSEGISEETHVQ